MPEHTIQKQRVGVRIGVVLKKVTAAFFLGRLKRLVPIVIRKVLEQSQLLGFAKLDSSDRSARAI